MKTRVMIFVSCIDHITHKSASVIKHWLQFLKSEGLGKCIFWTEKKFAKQVLNGLHLNGITDCKVGSLDLPLNVVNEMFLGVLIATYLDRWP